MAAKRALERQPLQKRINRTHEDESQQSGNRLKSQIFDTSSIVGLFGVFVLTRCPWKKEQSADMSVHKKVLSVLGHPQI
jgi:hypothetical protein